MKAAIRVVLVAVVGFLPVLPLEWACRYWVARFGDPLDRAQAVLQADASLGWRQRKNYRGWFMGLPLSTNELGLRNTPLPKPLASGKRIVILGPSSAFGWGVQESATYARRLEQALAQRFPLTPIAVINAGQIGYSSWQGLRLYNDELRRLKPDILILAYGINDVDRYRFFCNDPLPDRLALARQRPAWGVARGNLLGRLALFQRLRRGFAGLRSRLTCPLPKGAPAVPELRVGAQDYRDNLLSLLESAKQDGGRAILLTSGFQYPRLPEGPPGSAQRGRLRLAEGLADLKAARLNKAREAFQDALRVDPAQCDAYYALSAVFGIAGRCDEARRAFERARKAEPMRIERDLRAYNEIVRAVARQRGVPVVDIEDLQRSSRAGSLFLDPIHPNSRGHAVIAQALLAQIIKHKMLK